MLRTARCRSFVCQAALWIASAGAARSEEYLGPWDLALSPSGEVLYVALRDARQVAWIVLPEGKVVRRVGLPAAPTGLAVTPGGSTLVVTCAAPRSTIALVDTSSGKVINTIPAGHTANGPAISPDGKRLYVCHRFDNELMTVELASGRVEGRIAVPREPVAAVVTPDGGTVLVANHLPHSRTDAVYMANVAAEVTAIDTASGRATSIALPNGSHSLRDICLSPDGKYAYVTHILSNFELTPTHLDQGWVHVNTVSVIDTQSRRVLNTVGLDEMYSGAANPWGVVCAADGQWVGVSHAGTHQLSLIEASAARGSLVYLYISTLAGAIPDDPRVGKDLHRRVDLPGKGPRAVAAAGNRLYVAQYFSDSVAVVDLDDPQKPARLLPLGPEPQLSLRRRGELLFNDATICYQQWQSCASCHPDGRTDALNWDLMNDGLGNFKNTKSMVLAHRTPPAMAEGVRSSAEAAVRAGIQHILFADRPEEEAAAIDAYLKSLRPVPSPYLVDGQLSPAARRGQRLFHSRRLGCARCHPPPLYTDLKMHDVGTKTLYEFSSRFDTPTLIEAWRTAPYLHDGRYLTVQELLGEGKHGSSHGDVDGLRPEEISDLAQFVLSL
ncbi:MAG TPA: cell surface protein [Planctomycetes bacterium]|nr:cell surface protein [Planctomycetota bacterium]